MRSPRLWLTLVLVLTLARGAAAQTSDADLARVNTAAMDAFQELEIEKARALLEQAAATAEKNGVHGKALARIYGSLAVVHGSGLHDHAAALAAFRKALAEDPALETDPLVSTPEVEALFQQVRLERGDVQPQESKVETPPAAPTRGELGALCDAERPCASGLACVAGTCSMPDETPKEEAHTAKKRSTVRGFFRVGVGAGSALLSGSPALDRGPPKSVTDTVAGMTPKAAASFAHDSGYDCSARQAKGQTTLSNCTMALKDVGFVAQLALTLDAGVMVASRVYVSGSLRMQPLGHGKKSLAGFLLGARVGYWLVPPQEHGLFAHLFAGPSFGRIQVQANPPAVGRPWVTSGPFGVTLGGGLGYRFLPHLAVDLTVQLHALFPDTMFAADATLGPVVPF